VVSSRDRRAMHVVGTHSSRRSVRCLTGVDCSGDEKKRKRTRKLGGQRYLYQYTHATPRSLWLSGDVGCRLSLEEDDAGEARMGAWIMYVGICTCSRDVGMDVSKWSRYGEVTCTCPLSIRHAALNDESMCTCMWARM